MRESRQVRQGSKGGAEELQNQITVKNWTESKMGSQEKNYK